MGEQGPRDALTGGFRSKAGSQTPRAGRWSTANLFGKAQAAEEDMQTISLQRYQKHKIYDLPEQIKQCAFTRNSKFKYTTKKD